jgi:hypothetical protein
MESGLLALLSYSDLFQHVLRHLSARGYAALSLSCREMRDWLRGPGEELLRGLNYAQCGGRSGVRLRQAQTHARLFFSPRFRALLSLSNSGAECVALEEDGDVRCTTRCQGDALTTSPNGKLGCFVGAGLTMTVFEVSTGAVAGRCAAGGPVVYCCFDSSSSVLTWIFFTPPALRLGWFDLATMQRGDSGTLRGSPFFWHMSPYEPGVALAHTGDRVVLLNVLSEEMRPVVVFAQESSGERFQVPLLTRGGKSCLVASSSECGLILLQLSIEERSSEDCTALIAQALARADDPRLLHRFATGELMLMQSTIDDCVICGTLDEMFVNGLCEIDLRTRNRVPIDVPNALAFFLSPCSRFVLFLCYHLGDRQLIWNVYDRRSRAAKVADSNSAQSKMLLSNRRPFQCAYALSHSPWDKRSGAVSFCFVREDGVAVECRVLANDREFELAPTRPLSANNASLVWFS